MNIEESLSGLALFALAHVAVLVLCHLNNVQRHSMAYLGFQKGGPNFRWPLVLTQRGAKLSFPNFSYGEKKIFFAKEGPWPNGPLNTPLRTLYFVFKNKLNSRIESQFLLLLAIMHVSNYLIMELLDSLLYYAQQILSNQYLT